MSHVFPFGFSNNDPHRQDSTARREEKTGSFLFACFSSCGNSVPLLHHHSDNHVKLLSLSAFPLSYTFSLVSQRKHLNPAQYPSRLTFPLFLQSPRRHIYFLDSLPFLVALCFAFELPTIYFSHIANWYPLLDDS